jgi:hypothetical protein
MPASFCWIQAMTQHQEVPVKVNAWVDAGIADLVSALSEIDGLVTLESCQGDAARRNAFVMFRFGSWRDCGELLFERMMMAAMDDDLRSDMIRPIILLPPTTLSGPAIGSTSRNIHGRGRTRCIGASLSGEAALTAIHTCFEAIANVALLEIDPKVASCGACFGANRHQKGTDRA